MPHNKQPEQDQPHQPAPIGARSIDGRLAEALRRIRHGLIRPLWRDMAEKDKEGWINTASMFRVTVMKEVGLKVEITDT